MNRTEFLRDEIQFYGADPKGRRATTTSTSGFPTCAYKTEDGRKCAIGRWIPDRKHPEKLEGAVLTPFNDENPEVINALPLKLKKLGFHFLKRCQYLHDQGDNWNKRGKGLSREGRTRVKEICTEFELDPKSVFAK